MHYVDRHHLDDFAAYYVRSFSPDRRAHCERLHFFRTLSDDDLTKLLASAYVNAEERGKVEKALTESYLGFVVRRALPGAEVGRTVLRTYPIENDLHRHYEVLRSYAVSVAGLNLKIDGLAYQQQDGGAAVCASTALWVALQKVATMAGHRTPTPSAITTAAASPFPPSHGLDYFEMAGAIARHGYIADQFAPGDKRDLFRAKVIACLESHLPVILMLTRRQADENPEGFNSAHAITLPEYYERSPTPFTRSTNGPPATLMASSNPLRTRR